RGDRSHIGQNLSTDEKPISLQTQKLERGDVLWFFTDGLIDQFGGPMEKKFGFDRLRKLLLQNWNLSLREQKRELKASFADWQGTHPQIDDVLVLGVRY
ncbi:MAG: PP2C family protein-serine/threonine phosphatase, partial [Flavobacteriales bacterium]